MYRLSDDLTKKRLLYPSPLISAPSVLVINVPRSNRGTALPLGRYYPIILETDDECAEIECFLNEPRPKAVRPDIFDRRPSQLRSDNVLISRYEPPISGWPWLSVCRWPDNRARAEALPTLLMARGCYTMELFGSEAELNASQVEIVASLGVRHDIELRLLTAETMPMAGRA